MAYVPTYQNLAVTTGNYTINVNYVEAGAPTLPTILLLHGFPSSSNQFRDLIPMLFSNYHVLAPDLPGFGLTTTPADFKFTFDNLANVISAWLNAISITSYALYIFDYGAPVGLRLAIQNPENVKAIITQNGNAYVEGFGQPFWAPVFALWNSSNGQSERDYLRDNVLSLDGVKFQYLDGALAKDAPLINPQTYNLDYLQNVQGSTNQEAQLDLFYDYRTNVEKYPDFQAYFRQTQTPLLAVWGKNDPAFIPPGAEAFKRDLPNAVIRFVDTGHFALETKRWEIARIMLSWLATIGY